jgi:hypothetical protein
MSVGDFEEFKIEGSISSTFRKWFNLKFQKFGRRRLPEQGSKGGIV